MVSVEGLLVDWQYQQIKHLDGLRGWQAYFLEAQHVEFSGGDHLTVAVEIERNENETSGHYHSLKEKQYFGYMPETYN